MTQSRKRRLLLIAGILVGGFSLFQAIDYFTTPEEIKAGVIRNGMSYDLAKKILDGNGALENDKKYLGIWSGTGHPFSDWSLWSLRNGTTVWLTAGGPSQDQLTCRSIRVYPPGVDVKFSMGQDRTVDTLDLAEPWPVRLSWWLYLMGCLGTGISFLLSQESWWPRIAVCLMTCIGLLPYLIFNYPKPVLVVLDALLVGMALIRLGLMGFGSDGFPVTRSKRLTGIPAQVTGSICMGVGGLLCAFFLYLGGHICIAMLLNP